MLHEMGRRLVRCGQVRVNTPTIRGQRSVRKTLANHARRGHVAQGYIEPGHHRSACTRVARRPGDAKLRRMVKRKHFAPVFANKRWADATGHYAKFHRTETAVLASTAGREQWGQRKSGLWSLETEAALRDEIDTPTARIYHGMCEGRAPRGAERTKWAQFLLSQLVRTPTYIRYEKWVHARFGITKAPDHDRVGCMHCGDLALVTGRDWTLLLAHEDDFFVRTDNPVHLTGFVSRPQTALYYPLSRKLCFLACPMPLTWDRKPRGADPIRCCRLEKGGAHLVNFCFAKHADSSLILHPDDGSDVTKKMFTEMLGAYPQAPFSLHDPDSSEECRAFDSVRAIQEHCDGVNYPKWDPSDAEDLADAVAKFIRSAP